MPRPEDEIAERGRSIFERLRAEHQSQPSSDDGQHRSEDEADPGAGPAEQAGGGQANPVGDARIGRAEEPHLAVAEPLLAEDHHPDGPDAVPEEDRSGTVASQSPPSEAAPADPLDHRLTNVAGPAADHREDGLADPTGGSPLVSAESRPPDRDAAPDPYSEPAVAWLKTARAAADDTKPPGTRQEAERTSTATAVDDTPSGSDVAALGVPGGAPGPTPSDGVEGGAGLVTDGSEQKAASDGEPGHSGSDPGPPRSVPWLSSTPGQVAPVAQPTRPADLAQPVQHLAAADTLPAEPIPSGDPEPVERGAAGLDGPAIVAWSTAPSAAAAVMTPGGDVAFSHGAVSPGGAPAASTTTGPAAALRPVPPLPRVFAVANQKGGVGKTTTTVNLGASLAELGYRVLVVDLDPQGNATTGLGINSRNLEHSLYDVLLHDVALEDCVEPTSLRNLFVAPATIDLAGAEIELVPMFSRELRLRRAIEVVQDDFDYVLIDCPPSLGLLTVNGLAAATEVLVPIQCEYYALEGLGQLLRNVNLVQSNLNPTLDISTIVLTMYDARTKLAEQVAEEVRKHFGAKVCRMVIPRTVRLSEAPSFGQPVIVFDPTSRGAIAYRELAKEVSGGPPQRSG